MNYPYSNSQYSHTCSGLFRQRALILIALIVTALTAPAQKLEVASFELLENDLTAAMPPHMKHDLNGDKSALIKIETLEKGFTFDVGVQGVVSKIDQNDTHPGQIWLYVPQGVKSISMTHPVLGGISGYDLGGRLKPGKTYLMRLTTDRVMTTTVNYNHSQLLNVTVNPPDATLYLNGLEVPLDANGTARKRLNYGSYTYHITAPNHHPKDGRIEINNRARPHELNVQLKPAFGYLSVSGVQDAYGADVYVDGEHIGTLPIRQHTVGSGPHKVTIRQKLFKPYSQEVNVADSTVVTVTPLLLPNYAEVTIRVANDPEAQIYDEGTFLGTGTWRGRLEAGTHRLEANKIGYSTTAREVTIEPGVSAEFVLEAPQPVFGSLELSTVPEGAEVYIDDKKVGKTPFVSGMITVGSHKVDIKRKGYRPEQIYVDIEENSIARQRLTLTDFCTATITTNPSNADLYIDGEYIRSKPHTLNVHSGDYRITARANGYTSYNKTLHIDGNTDDIVIRLHRNYVNRNEFYFQAGYEIAPMSAFNFGAGFFYHNVNVEGNYLLGMSTTDKIYWSDRTGSASAVAVDYKPSGGNVKLGYGIRIGTRVRLTPQVGCQFISLKENYEDYYYGDSVLDGCSAVSATFGARVHAALLSWLGVSVTPQYLLCVHKSPGYEALADISSTINDYTEGFGLNISLNLFF